MSFGVFSKRRGQVGSYSDQIQIGFNSDLDSGSVSNFDSDLEDLDVEGHCQNLSASSSSL